MAAHDADLDTFGWLAMHPVYYGNSNMHGVLILYLGCTLVKEHCAGPLS
jgi:hypothetical protein